MLLRSACVLGTLAFQVFSQTPNSPPANPIYRVTIVQRTTPAINYSHRSEPTKIDFKGTALLSQAHGEATVENRRGATMVDAHFSNVPPPTRFGAQYLTYVVWAISPDGRAQSVGELVLNGSDKGHLTASTPMQAFALIVTAEPYFSVSQPSDVVVMENVIRPETVGEVEEVNATYELLPRKEYTYTVPAPQQPASGPGVSMKEYEAVVATYQAKNAIEIARAAGADRYAQDRLSHAEQIFDQARGYPPKTLGEEIVAKMREAAQIAEDARVIAAKRSQEDRLAQQRAQTAEAAKEALAERAAAESAQEQARVQADRAQAGAARAAAAAEQTREQLDAQSAARAAETRSSVQSADRMRLPPPDTTRETRAALKQRLGSAFTTLDSPRGLVMIVPNSLLESGSGIASVSSRLAIAASALKPFSGLRIEVEGNTDGSPSESVSYRHSQELAERARDMLVAQGIPAAWITARGYGSARPIAPNLTAGGREQNRRIEIVIAGDAIGTMATWDRTYPLKPR